MGRRIPSGVALVALVLAGCADPRPSSEPSPAARAPAQPRETSGWAAEPPKDEIVIAFGGDVNLGRDVGQRILANADFNPLGGIEPLFDMADLGFVNLESPLSDQDGQTRHPTEPLVFTGPPAGAALLSASGVQLVSVANNHVWDYGKEGFFETLEHLGKAGVAYAGGSVQVGQQYEPTIVRVAGWSVAVFAVTEVWNPGTFETHEGNEHVAWADPERLVPRIRLAKRQHDVVIVSYHGGREYAEAPAVEPIVFSRAVMAAGADLFVGHHPHVTQGMRWVDGRPVLYSLGNLVFGTHRDHAWTGRGYLARVWFSKDHAPAVDACPYVIDQEAPRLLNDAERSAMGRGLRARLRRLSLLASVEGSRISEPDEDGCMAVDPPSAG